MKSLIMNQTEFDVNVIEFMFMYILRFGRNKKLHGWGIK